MTDFDFSFDPRYRRLLGLLGVTPRTSRIRVADGWLAVRFGRWQVRTPLANITGVEPTGPYRAYRAIGARLSLADRGLTFGSTTKHGLCISFHRPVRGIEPVGVLRHPSLTVTPVDPHGLAQALKT
jgi:hypothetical protein